MSKISSIINGVVSSALVASMFTVAPSVSEAQTIEIPRTNIEDFQQTNLHSLQQITVDSSNLTFVSNHTAEINKLNGYIDLGSDGLLHISDDGKTVASKEVFDYVADGVSILNKGIQSKQLLVDQQNQTVIPNSDTSSKNYSAQTISPNAYTGVYAWGYALTLSQSETEELAYLLSQQSKGYATAGAIATAIGGYTLNAPAAAAGVSALLVALGTDMISTSLRQRNNPKGTTLNLHWAPPYYEVTVNK